MLTRSVFNFGGGYQLDQLQLWSGLLRRELNSLPRLRACGTQNEKCAPRYSAHACFIRPSSINAWCGRHRFPSHPLPDPFAQGVGVRVGAEVGIGAGVRGRGKGATPAGVPGTPVGVPGTPVRVPATPAGVPGTPVGVPGTPVGVPGIPVGVPGTRVCVLGTPLGDKEPQAPDKSAQGMVFVGYY